MSLLVLKPGLSTTVQDYGRPGYRAWGVPIGGAFDVGSYELANALVGNRPGAAALELTLLGGTFEAKTDLALALAGAPMGARIERAGGEVRTVTIPRSLTLRAGVRLVLGATPVGARTYLAVAGGIRTPAVLGSRSSEVALRAGEAVPVCGGTTVADRRPAEPFPVAWGPDQALRVIDGPDATAPGFDPAVWERLVFHVGSHSNRMGLRLEGPEVPIDAPADRISAPVAPGAVQLAGGRPIVLGVACGTMGGYPHVAHVIAADLPRLGQLRPGQPVRLRRVALAEARALDRRERQARAARRLQVATLARDRLGPGN